MLAIQAVRRVAPILDYPIPALSIIVMRMQQGRRMRDGGAVGWKGLVVAAALVLLAACAPVRQRPVAPVSQSPGMILFHGSAMYRERMALPQGSTLSVSLLQTSAGGTRMLAQVSGLPATHSPVPFAFSVPRTLLQSGYAYALSARITDAQNHALWVQAAPATVDHAVADESVTLWLVRAAAVPAAQPAPMAAAPVSAPAPTQRGPAYVIAEGREPQWSARIYGLGAARSLHTSIGHDNPLRQSHVKVERQRLNSGVVVYTTADGFISLTISPGACRLRGSKKVLAWRAVLETPAASYRGCARGFP